jgi:Ca2+-transporting ATPase
VQILNKLVGYYSLSYKVEPAEVNIMDRPPRPAAEGVMTPKTWIIIVLQGLVQSMATLTVYLLSQNGAFPSIDTLKKQRSLAFCLLTTLQIFQAFLSRSVELSIFTTGVLGNRWLLGATFGSFAALVLGAYLPGLNRSLELEGPGAEWWVIVVCVVIQLVVVELLKLLMRFIQKK